MRELLEQARFIDIKENNDGTFDATKDGTRYYGMYFSNYGSNIESIDSIVVEPVTFTLGGGPSL